ncbi:hypothetical protein AB1Y20_011005 [Prymnesium parvum]|uniref:Armadillo repeat-containing protein 8 n=1 Tax=Prymnesium parvum TaxID=97485 RepID=A0AB34IND7_PRYPA
MGEHLVEDLLDAARRAPIISQITIDALESQIGATKSTIEPPEHWHSESDSGSGSGSPMQASGSPPYALCYEPREVDPNVEAPVPKSINQEDCGLQCQAGLVPRSPCDQRDHSSLRNSRDSSKENFHSVSVEIQKNITTEEDEQRSAAELFSIIASLCNKSQALKYRQLAAHKLARDLARKPAAYTQSQLELYSPVRPVLALLAEDDSYLTRQLVLACLTNVASVAMHIIAAESPTVPEILLAVLRDGDADPALRAYGLAMAFNLSQDEGVMTWLERAGATPIVRNLASLCPPGGSEAKHSAEVLRVLRRYAPKRPSSAAKVISRVSSFSRNRIAIKEVPR